MTRIAQALPARAEAAPLRLGRAQEQAERQAEQRAAALLAAPAPPFPPPASPPGGGPALRFGGGQPLPAAERAYFEPRLGRDLGGVRLHQGGAASLAARAIGARAFAQGADIALAVPRPDRALLAHELAHVAAGEAGVVRRALEDEALLRGLTPEDLKDLPDERLAALHGFLESVADHAALDDPAFRANFDLVRAAMLDRLARPEPAIGPPAPPSVAAPRTGNRTEPVANTLEPADPRNFPDFGSYRSANPHLPEATLRSAWDSGEPPAPEAPAPAEPVAAEEPAEEPGLLDEAGDYLRSSTTGQFVLGLGTGGLAGATPGGFVVGIGGEASGAAERFPRAFRMGYGLGETTWGIAQIVVGAFGEVGGGGLAVAGGGATATGVGAPVGLPAMAGGAGIMAVSTAAIMEGTVDLGTGWGVFMSAWREGDDLPEGTHSITDDPNADLTQSVTNSPRALGENLERAGMPRPAGHEPHHVAPAKDPRGARALEIIEEAGIRVDDATNGVWLPRTSANPATPGGIVAEAATSHDAIHTATYFRELTARLERAREADRVLEELELIRGQIELGIFPF